MTRTIAPLLISSTVAAAQTAPTPLLCEPGESYVADDFSDPESSAARWFFREYWTVRDGALVRSALPAENQRVFIRKPEFKDAIIKLDLAFDGAGEIRVMTGSNGPYNAVVTVWPHGFRVFTAKDDRGPYLPTPHGECALQLTPGKSYPLSLEFFADELVVQVAGETIVARHPILDQPRTYFAFQVDRPLARFDNVSIRHAKGRKAGWAGIRTRLLAAQSGRPWLPKDDLERRKDLELLTRDRLFRNDPEYRRLVDAVASARAAEKDAYPEVFKSLKERKKKIVEERDRLLAEDPEFKPARTAIHVARRAEDEYLKAKHPELEKLSSAAAPLALAERRRKAEEDDPDFAKLVAATAALQTEFENRYPTIHIGDAELQQQGRDARESAKGEPEFQALIKATSLAVRAEKDYVYAAEPKLEAPVPPKP